MTFGSVSNMVAKEIMLAMNSEALSLGYCSLKKEQKDIILDFTMGNDVFARRRCHFVY